MNKTCSLKSASELITKGTTPTTIGGSFTLDGVNFVKSESICDSKYLNSTVYLKISGDTDIKLKRSRLKEGDLLFSIAGAYLGKLSIVRKKDLPANTNQAVGIVRLNKDIADVNYIYYFFSQPLMNEYINKLSSQSSQPNMNLDLLGKLIFNYIRIEEQKTKSKVLSVLDEKIELNTEINSELEAVAKFIYDYWFLQFDFPDANGNPYKSSGGKMVYNDELKREIPEGWSNGTLNELGEIVGGSTPSTKDAANFSENGIPWITPKDLSLNVGNKYISRGAQDVSDEGMKSASLKIYPKGTVLMSSRAPIGYMAIAREELTTNQGFKSFIPNRGFSSDFIFYTVNNSMKAIVQYSSGSTFKEVSGSVLKTVKICLPETDISDIYTTKVESIFKRQNLLEIENNELSKLRDWLLPMLMNGQVTIK